MPFTEYDPPERFVAGTVGPPGQRTFFLQARTGGRVTSVSIEKVQVSVLADKVNDLLDQVGAPDGDALVAVVGPPDTAALDTPIEDEFRVNTLSLAWDVARERVVIEAHDRDPDEEEGEPESLRVVLTGPQARAFARRAQEIVAAGRPPCPFCGGPLEVEGHICPRANGYRR
ncbi:conserved hypothetical protein [Nostocoides japonicum T1-X7]|uniref:DUF3090 domain-containing protein n=1 Tax=Nostocoides japonicum T1-X7 TaxID=1194083 RepID=A0A077LWT3_9MICO|nr:DUF3090 domain-containing protein [Tetrasphaera japonica]CCH76395.1 conserved hypothetical protein [Tetrasphaera japonica T1-X7]